MFNFLKQSTATQSKTVGPFVDDTDFKTAETGLSIANTDVKLSKNGATGVNKNSGGGTHRNNGMYSLTFDATDTDTVGELEGSIAISGALIVTFKFMVIEESIYDALFGASAAGFNASGLVTLAAATHTGAVIPTVSTLTGHTAQTGDSFARLGSPAGASIAADLVVIDDFVDDIEGRLPTSLISGRMSSDVQGLIDDTGAANRLARFFAGGQHGTATTGSANTITLNGSADSNDDFFNGSIVVLSNGTGKRQYRLITDYNGTTKVATVSPNWIINPDSSTEYSVITLGLSNIVAISGSTASADNAELDYDGTGYDKSNSTIGTATVLTNKTGFSLAATGLDAIVATATGMVEIAKAIWDRLLIGATHNINNSAGKRLRSVADTIILSDTAQAGADTTITLNAGASVINDAFTNMRLITTGGTGAGQVKIIGPYDGTTKVATVLGGAWLVNPDATTEFEIIPALTHAVGTNQDLAFGYAVSATSTTIVLNGIASAINDFYDDDLIIIHVGTGKGQSRTIKGYIGATKTVTVDQAWITNPDSTSEYVIIGSDRVWDHSTADHAIAGSFGKAVADTLVDTADIQPKIGTPAADVSADIAAVKVDTAATLVDTADMQPKLGSPAGTDISADIADIPTVSEFEARTLTAADIAKLSASVGTIVSAAVETGTLSSTQMTSDLSEATNDHYIGRIILWTSGPLVNQATDITDYVGASGLLTFTEVTDVPVNGNTFIIV